MAKAVEGSPKQMPSLCGNSFQLHIGFEGPSKSAISKGPSSAANDDRSNRMYK